MALETGVTRATVQDAYRDLGENGLVTGVVGRGTTVLDAALEYGICIPHLCHMTDLSPFGACRLCIVEHVNNGRSRITTSWPL